MLIRILFIKFDSGGNSLQHWKTHSRWVRLFSTLYVMIIVNGFKLYLYEYRDHYFCQAAGEDEEDTFIDFQDKLAYQMINNKVDGVHAAPVVVLAADEPMMAANEADPVSI